jgi:hypothetical protein
MRYFALKLMALNKIEMFIVRYLNFIKISVAVGFLESNIVKECILKHIFVYVINDGYICVCVRAHACLYCEFNLISLNKSPVQQLVS